MRGFALRFVPPLLVLLADVANLTASIRHDDGLRVNDHRHQHFQNRVCDTNCHTPVGQLAEGKHFQSAAARHAPRLRGGGQLDPTAGTACGVVQSAPRQCLVCHIPKVEWGMPSDEEQGLWRFFLCSLCYPLRSRRQSNKAEALPAWGSLTGGGGRRCTCLGAGDGAAALPSCAACGGASSEAPHPGWLRMLKTAMRCHVCRRKASFGLGSKRSQVVHCQRHR